MAEISIGHAVRSGFGLIRHKPLTVLAWGLAQAAGFAVFFAAYAYFLAGIFPLALKDAAAGATVSDSETMAFMGHMLMGEGFLFLAMFVMMTVRVLVMTATWRAVLHPERSRWAYLRVGKAEGFILLLLIGLAFAGNIIVIPLMPIVMIAGALAAFHQWVAAVIVGVVGIVAMIAAILYFELRFSMVGPMIVDDDKFHFVEAWKLTKGKVGNLFLVGLSLFGVLMLAELVIGLIVLGVGIVCLGQAVGDTQHLQAFVEQTPQAIAMQLAPLAILLAVGLVPVAGAGSAIIGAPWARAYRDLAPAPADGPFA